MRYKITQMNCEIADDARAKVGASMDISYEHTTSPEFHVGKLTCTIRKKYARMIFLYMRSLNMFDEFTEGNHIVHMLEVQDLRWAIDHLVEMVEMEAEEKFKREDAIKAAKERIKQQQEQNKNVRWQLQQDTNIFKNSIRNGDKKEDETNKYMNGFDSDFNR
ncbi:uncharacterized protein LOC135087086 [Ostrinia nubilalis]|uniref:uncharacterized protein LOC135087086 n=1 Tax=Ostrinia nubilalis TaxID=29057 RepID=UPI0030823D3C